ncbi:MAG TPA: pyrroloquinoline quinone-dependent dehydrogenase [Acidobacteriaceae bacterium]
MKLRGGSLFWLLALSLGMGAAQSPQHSAGDWPTYGGDAGGMRYTTARQITSANVSTLTPAWTFHTGAIAKQGVDTAKASFEATPVLFRGTLYVTSPFDQVFAVNPSTGAGLWQFDPNIKVNPDTGVLTSRGVAAWPVATTGARAANTSGACAGRIFVATMDARLIALDAATGAPCQDFGAAGTIDLSKNVGNFQKNDPYFFTSPPTVIGDLVIVGSAVGDNQRVDIDSGVVRAFDCRSGRLVWSWDPIPWAQRQKLHTGAANAWSVIAADPAHNLVFIPTGAPSPDFYGVTRAGDNRDANSVVALEATTGRRVWGFQVVHHDLWDYDVASEPLLFTFRGKVPAIAITTKMGLLFVLNRLTGEPLYPIAERPVPASDIPGEQASPTQPFQDIASLSPTAFPPDAHFGASSQDDAYCRQAFKALRYDGIYTPPTTRGSLMFPGSLGGVDWGGASFDPATGILYANTNRYAFRVSLNPRPSPLRARITSILNRHIIGVIALCAIAGIVVVLLALRFFRRAPLPRGAALGVSVVFLLFAFAVLHHLVTSAPKPLPASVEHFGHEVSAQLETPYLLDRAPIVAPSGMPCTVQPWGTVSAVNLDTGKSVWQTPLGTLVAGRHTGTVNLGGTIVTASGLVFTAASEQPLLRAFNAATGEEVWDGALPVPAQSTPMSYTIDGRQFVVIAAGGHGAFGTPVSDALVAFALPKQ